MGQPVPLALSTLWVLGCFSLLLWLWVLCTVCHRYVCCRQELEAGPLLRQTHLCSLSKSDTRLHELHHSPRSSTGEPLGGHVGWGRPSPHP
uniref:Uncharacterized protein n=1 Tax=Sciurus vulgaris TaxID=55149 RepID=A0A8D2CTD9_SCIVU